MIRGIHVGSTSLGVTVYRNHYRYANRPVKIYFACANLMLNCGGKSEFVSRLQVRCRHSFAFLRCEADLVHGDDEYDMRSLFPGQPFKKNEFLPKSDSEPKPICTPSIKGSAASRGIGIFVLVSSIVVHTAYWF